MKKLKTIVALIVSLAMVIQISAFGTAVMAEEESDRFQAILENTNMYGDAGSFDNGTFESDGWTASGGITMEVSDKQSYSGDYSSLHKLTASAGYYYKSISGFQANKTYITSAMILGTDANTNLDPNYNTQWVQKFNHYLAISWSSTPQVEAFAPKLNDMNKAPLSTEEGQQKLPKEDWTQMWKVFTTGSTAPSAVAPGITPILAGAEFYVDDYYCGELMVADIVNDSASDAALIPASGETSMNLSAKALNQLGNEGGLKDSTYTWELVAGDFEGITLDGDVLRVSSDANPGEIILAVTCNPTFLGADSQTEEQKAYRTKEFTITVKESTPEERMEALLNNTNMYGTAGSFENGNFVSDGWTCSGDGTMEISSKQSYSGDYSSLHKVNKAGDYYYKSLSGFQANKTYITSAMILGTDANTNLDPNYNNAYVQKFLYHTAISWGNTPEIAISTVKLNDMNSAPLSSEENQEKLPKEDWTQLWKIFTTGDTAPQKVGPAITPVMVGAEYYADNYYCGELIVADLINKTESDSVVIPVNGTNTLRLKASAVNQLGNTAGLDNSTYTFKLKDEQTPGVSIGGDVLTVTPDAYEQDLKIIAECVPVFKGAENQSDEQKSLRKKEIKIALIAPPTADRAPKAKNVIATGSVAIDNVLSVDYDFWQINNLPEGDSVITWYKSENLSGPWEGFNVGNTTYKVLNGEENLFFKVGIIPETAGEVITGNEEFSNILVKPAAPVAENVKITGIQAVGEILTATFDFSDKNGDGMGECKYQWLRADAPNGPFAPIGNADSDKYEVTEDDIDKYIMVVVTPVADKEPNPGEDTPSTPVLAATRATVADFKINANSANVLSVSYKYNHPMNIGEGESICNWYIGETLIGTGMSIDASGYVGNTVTAILTPVAEKKPFEGVQATASYRIKSDSYYGGGGSGGGGGGGIKGNSSVTVKDSNVKTPQEQFETPVVTEIRNIPAWALDAVSFVIANKFMDTVTSGDFAGDAKIDREEFLAVVLKSVGIEGVPYRNEFEDVKESEFAKLLQASVDLGVISKADKFYPERNLARDEMCKILIESLKVACKTELPKASVERFADGINIMPWAKGYVENAVGIGLVIGVSETEFAPRGDVTRAQTAVIVKRLAEYIKAQGGNK